jgi:predicted DNA-binding transcriptional regulator AlpA
MLLSVYLTKPEVTAMTQENSAARLIDRKTLLARVPMSYPRIWKLMREGAFPRGRAIGGRTFWLEREVDDFINGTPPRQLKGDIAAA